LGSHPPFAAFCKKVGFAPSAKPDLSKEAVLQSHQSEIAHATEVKIAYSLKSGNETLSAGSIPHVL